MTQSFRIPFRLSMAIACVLLLASLQHAHADTWYAGFGKVEITPTEPVRLSGYATRDKPHTGVADPLHARAMVLTNWTEPNPPASLSDKQTGKRTMVLVSIDSIAVVAPMTRQVAEVLEKEYGLTRADFVLCSTHSHAAPHASSGLTNLYRTPLSVEEQAAIDRHAARVSAGIIKAIAEAMSSRKQAILETAQSQANFAVNRRVLKNGVWSGFGIQSDGPVDRRVQLLKAATPKGELLGAAYLYACHCTTLGPSFNEVSADWAGMSAVELEKKHDGAVFLPVIGCGADANPEPRTGYKDAQAHSAEMTASVEKALSGQWKKIETFPDGHFGYAGLAPEHPTRDELDKAKTDKDATRRVWAENMLGIWAKMGRLPETYPAPIHTWSFGKELIWVFMGGEVVVDYQIRLEKNLSADNVWVAAYTDDVFAYVASERMRAEGGYEVDFSMLYYNQPGRWQSGTEELIERRVKEILKESDRLNKATDPSTALKSIRVPPGYTVDLIAAEPLVNDPVNIAFGHDGTLWVVEMSDYPLGSPGGGRVRTLRDTNGDGVMDESKVFLSDLSYPSSVTPWRDGAIVISSPSVFFAADRDGDGRAEVREELLTGIASANPQHRASGFEVGLDGWLNFTCGDNTKVLKSARNGQEQNVAGRDLRFNPDTGEFQTTTGHTQYIRARDEFGNWFGNVNNQPIYHYVVEDKYRKRTGLSGAPVQHLLTPAVAPPVLPYSRTQDRFNDLFTLNRFTSACSSIICRVPGLGPDMRGAALVCEPVHNLVARFKVKPDGASFSGSRFEEDKQFDWFASSDSFSRPVRVVNAPDGTVWIVDMVRLVIEHPEWIPTAWQERLDVRSGTGLGRIYRVRQSSFSPTALPRIDRLTSAELLQSLESDNGALRDLAAQQLLWRSTPAFNQQTEVDSSVVNGLTKLARHAKAPEVRAQAIGTLVGMHRLSAEVMRDALVDADPRVRRFVISVCDDQIFNDQLALETVHKQLQNENDPGVLLQLALSTAIADPNVDKKQASTLAHIVESVASRAPGNAWLERSLAMTSEGKAEPALRGLLSAIETSASGALNNALEQTIATLWQRSSEAFRSEVLRKAFAKSVSGSDASLSSLQIALLTAVASGSRATEKKPQDGQTNAELLERAINTARTRLFDASTKSDERLRLVPILAIDNSVDDQQLERIVGLLGPRESAAMQQAALNVLRRLKSDATPKQLFAHWSEYLPETRTSICSMLLERPSWGEQLVSALETGVIKVTDLDASVTERLRSYGGRSLMARSERVLGAPPNRDREKIIQNTMTQLNPQGDRTRGEVVFTQHCSVCHRATPEKPLVGPPLENISNWTRQQWIVAILDPNRNIEPKYHQFSVLTKDGRALNGLIEDRSEASLTIAAADGKRHEIPLDEIEQLKDLGTSLMPEGLETKLDVQALSDLITYLELLTARK